MTLIVCLDDQNGLLFNMRRQSRDRCVYDRILDITSGNRLFMNEYSAELFSKEKITVSPDFLALAGESDCCFVEDADILAYTNKVQQVIVYRWNRLYPADKKFPWEHFSDFMLLSTYHFPGNSHDLITEEIYKR